MKLLYQARRTVKTTVRRVGRECRDALLLCGIGPKLHADNRVVLEKQLFPWILAQAEYQRILFVGCQWYTWHYNNIFRAREFWTIDSDQRKKRYGSSRHMTDSVTELPKYLSAGSIDCILMIGVIGWGLDHAEPTRQALEACHHCLRPGGLFVLGVDEVPNHMPFDYTVLPEEAGFQSLSVRALGTARYRCQGELNHTLTFYQALKN